MLSSAHGTSRRPDQRRKGPLPGIEREESLRARIDAIDPKRHSACLIRSPRRRASRIGAISRPSVLAVLRLMSR